MQVEHIHLASDERLEPYRSVRDRDALGADGRPGLFIGESPLVVEAMLHAPIQTLSILTAERNADRAVELVAQRPSRADPPPRILVAPDDVLDSVVGFNIHRGFLAVGERPPLRTVAQVLAPAGVPSALLCIEDVNNMDNIGQLFRNAAAFGCDAVLLSPACHDPLYRKSLRVSCGCALKVPFAWSTAWDSDLRALHADHGYAVVGASGGGAETIAACAQRMDLLPPADRRVAVVVGAEFAGLRASTLEACSARVRIPMARGVDSLNVAVAAAILLERLTLRAG